MALFDAPNLLPAIFQREQFPSGSGITALATGLIGGLQGSKSAKQEDGYSFMDAMSRGMQRGAELNQSVQNPVHPLQRAVQEQNIRMAEIQIGDLLLRRETAIKQREGMAKLQSWLSDKDLSNPETYKGALGIAAQYGLDEQVTAPFFKRMNDSLLMRERIRLMEVQHQSGTAPIANFKKDSELRSALAAAEASGDPAAVESARADLERFRQFALSETKLGLSRPLSEDAALRAVLGLTELSDMDRLLGTMPMEDKEAIRRVLSIRDRLQGTTSPASALPQSDGDVLNYDPATDTLE